MRCLRPPSTDEERSLGIDMTATYAPMIGDLVPFLKVNLDAGQFLRCGMIHVVGYWWIASIEFFSGTVGLD